MARKKPQAGVGFPNAPDAWPEIVMLIDAISGMTAEQRERVLNRVKPLADAAKRSPHDHGLAAQFWAIVADTAGEGERKSAPEQPHRSPRETGSSPAPATGAGHGGESSDGGADFLFGLDSSAVGGAIGGTILLGMPFGPIGAIIGLVVGGFVGAALRRLAVYRDVTGASG
jgi:alkanesulfonate monooxygenase SsuD/methylene tetrahydromethanopterin reductase-like flavin-dependent oxidoreductase (luciferase family)